MSAKKSKSVVTIKNTTVKGDDEKTPVPVEEATLAVRYGMWSGSLPPADELKKYDPEIARTIVDMALNEQKMRSDIIVATRDENMRDDELEKSGQRYAFIILFACIVCACAFACLKMEDAACHAIWAVVAFTGINVFIRRKSAERRDEPDSVSKSD